jgi:Holliday junction DNA helicase RuvB
MHTPDMADSIILQDMADEQSLDFVPRSFSDYIGQQALKDKLIVYTQAAQMRNEPLDHMLLFGPPGLGKTTLSQIMAQEMRVGIKICSGPMVERTGDLVAILSSLCAKDILFIDEIHRMPTHVEEILYSAMEHFRVDVILGQGAGAKSVSLPIAPFTLIGATTKSGMLSAPLRSRFGITERLEFYTQHELQTIVLQNAAFLGTPVCADGALEIAKRARGTPRIAKKIVRRVRDFAQVHNNNCADHELVKKALHFLALDDDGLTKVDNLLLSKIIEHFNGGPVGLETVASLIGEDADTIETVYEPYLLQQGYLERTPRGRQIPGKKLPLLHKKYNGQYTIT